MPPRRGWALPEGDVVIIHFHGTPITPKDQLLRMAGRHFCVSYFRPDNLETCLKIGQSVMFDNGAFSAKTRGQALDVPGYYAWLEPMLAHPHWAVIPDVIDGTEDEQRKLRWAWRQRFPLQMQLGAPVWHLGLSLDYLLEICDAYERVCFGSSGQYWEVGSPAWAGRMDEAFNYLHQHRARLPWVHGLRMLSQVRGGWPLASADSTNVGRNFKDQAPGCAECLASRIDAEQPVLRWKPRAVQMELIA